jgi:hypothetical protein
MPKRMQVKFRRRLWKFNEIILCQPFVALTFVTLP